MAMLLYQGHGSYRIILKNGMVIYVDPFAGEGYDIPGDIVLITHEHYDHNNLDIITKKDDCTVLRASEMLVNGEYKKKSLPGITIEAVPAYNKNHDKASCVGYVMILDGVKIYGAGDTSYTDYMEKVLSKEDIDYALLPIDGVYNMDILEGELCAEVIKAKHTIPIHMKPGSLFSQEMADTFKGRNKLIVKPGEEISLWIDSIRKKAFWKLRFKEAGADYIKTSTGFGTSGAKMSGIELFKRNIGESVKIKAAGGIRTREQMEGFLLARCDRLGCSSGIAALYGHV